MSTPEQERELEQALIDLRQHARDGRGLRIMLGGDLTSVAIQFDEFARSLVQHCGVPAHVPSRLNELRNLELLARVYRLMLEVLPRHSHGCSNQNVVDPLGAYRGVAKCGCNPDAQGHFLSATAADWLGKFV